MARIAFEIAELVYGSTGLHRYTSGLLPALLRQNNGRHKFVLFSPAPIRARTHDILDFIVKTQGVSIKLFPYPPRIFEWLRHLWPILTLEHLTGSVDIVHTQGFTLLPPCKNAFTIISLHGISPIRTPEHYSTLFLARYKAHIRHLLNAADYIIALTEDNRRAIVKLLGVPEECISVIPSGIDNIFHPYPNEEILQTLKTLNLRPHSFILYVGNLEHNKNIRILLEAFALLPASLKENYLLVLAGPGDPEALGWIRLACDLKIEKRLRWVGYIPPHEIPLLMSGARLFLFPSFCEGFALPPLEAMACGCPVIVSNASSLPETVGEGGIHIAVNDLNEWANTMNLVLTDDTLRKNLSERGQKRAREFTWEKTANETISLYETLLSGGIDKARSIWPKQHRKKYENSN